MMELGQIDATAFGKKGLQRALCRGYSSLDAALKVYPLRGDFLSGVSGLGDYQKRDAKYPKLALSFSDNDIASLAEIPHESSAQLLGRGHTPLEKLLLAYLWKRGEIHKVHNVVEGMTEPLSERNVSDVSVMQQFGRHLVSPDEPIVDQHTVRAYLYHRGRDVSDPRLSLSTAGQPDIRAVKEHSAAQHTALDSTRKLRRHTLDE